MAHPGSRRPAGGHPAKRAGGTPAASGAASRQRDVSSRIARSTRRPKPGGREAVQSSAPLTRARKGSPARIRPSGILLRFIACGIISIAAGLTWRLTLAPSRLGAVSALLGCVILLSGFVVGGFLWYLRDARLRSRDARLVDDEQIIFSFIVFCVVPFVVLGVLLVVWLIALVIGGG